MECLIAVTDSPAGDDLSIERAVLAGMRVEKVRWRDQAGLIEALREADAVLCMHAPISRAVIEQLRRCRVIVRYGTGLDNIDRSAAAAAGIAVAGIHDYCTEEVANHVLALLLAWNRKILAYHRFVERNIWNQRENTTGNWGCGPVSRLSRQTLGLLGFGRVGRAVAERARVFGIGVLACDTQPDRAAAERLGVRLTAREELLASSDFVSLHVPLTEQTRRLIDAPTIGRMKPGAVLINTARGGLVDEQALVAALSSGRLAGALLDVYEKAPLPADHPLRALENVTLTPHVAFYSEEALLDLRRLAAEAVKEHLTHADC